MYLNLSRVWRKTKQKKVSRIHVFESEQSVEKNIAGESKLNTKNVVFNNSNTGSTSRSTVNVLEKVGKKKSIKTKFTKSTNATVGKNKRRSKIKIPEEKITKYFHTKVAGSLPSKIKLSPSLLGCELTGGGGEKTLICGGFKSKIDVGFGGGEANNQVFPYGNCWEFETFKTSTQPQLVRM